MKYGTTFMLALCLAGATAACADADRPANRAPDATVGTAGTAAEAPKDGKAAADREAGRADRDFVGDMMADGRAEVDLGKLAAQKARNAKVKAFAAMMVRDHQTAGAELKTLASQANVDMTKVDPDMDHGKDVRERLSKLSGTEFDLEYMKTMVEQHEQAVKDVEDKAEDADDDHVKQWAAKTLPALKKHLAEAKEIHESLEKRSGT